VPLTLLVAIAGLIALGAGAGLLITRWWLALLVPIAAGLLARVALGDQGDFPDWALPWTVGVLVLIGLAAGALGRFVADELRRKPDGSRPG
jgi:hypothetical protein